MTKDEIIKTLTTYNQWRREALIPAPDPRVIGRAIDCAIAALSAPPINTDDMNDIVLAGLAQLDEQQAGDLLEEMDSAPTSKPDCHECSMIGQAKCSEHCADVPAKADSDPNAPWLTLAHSICADAGIPPGHITKRLESLRDKLDVPAKALTDEKILALLSEHTGFDRQFYREEPLQTVMNSYGHEVDMRGFIDFARAIEAELKGGA